MPSWKIPGTALTGQWEDAPELEERFSAMFLGGDISLSQVAQITGLEPYTVQNWVKRGFLSPPRHKRYTLRQLCRVMIIAMLKAALPMERICALLGYVNGDLDDEGDDLIDDTLLHFAFVRLAARTEGTQISDEDLRQALSHYQAPTADAQVRVEQVLRIMLTAWRAAELTRRAEEMTAALALQKGEST